MAAVERILGESAETILGWEERYGLPSGERATGTAVLYSRDDVERLRHVAQELASGREPAVLGPGSTSEARRARPGDGPQILVLLAERDPRAADLEEYFLRTEGYQVEVSLSALEAEAGALAMRPDVAVVELSLSGHTGLDLCRRLKEVADVAVVAVSSLDSRDQAFAAGAEAFLLKPLDPLVLISTIKDLLGASAFLRPREGASGATS
jgi:CheY-like chemotaxis protein